MLKENMHKKLLLLMILGIFFLSFVSSAPPVTTVQQFTEGLILEYPLHNYHKQGTDFDFHFHVFNISNGVYLTSDVTCYFHLYNSTGNHVLKLFDNAVSNEFDYSFKVMGGNFTDTGVYYYIAQCNTSSLSGFTNHAFEVTPNGEEVSTGKSIFYIGLLFTLLFFFAVAVFFFTDTENILGKVGSLGMGYLLLIAITFVSWNMASDFFTSATFLVGMMKTLFYVFLVGLFPLIIGLFIWYFLMLFKIKEIQRLMDKGFSFDDAKRRTGGKYK